jgi:GMP synthase-like glutamine amidotransferase
MGHGGDGATMMLSRTVTGKKPSDENNRLNLCMLGCETKPPYGPNHHTAELLLDLLCMAAERHCTYLSWTISIHIFDVQAEEYPHDFDEYGGVLVPGSFSSAYDTDPWIVKLKQVLQTEIVANRMPTLAICFGHQILAHSFAEGHATSVPSGARVGRHTAKCTLSGTNIFGKESIDMFFTHGDMVARLPPVAICLAGNEAVPVQAAAYFDSADDARRFQEGANDDPPKPFAITFQAHPEYATSQALGIERTLEGCMAAMEKRSTVDPETRARASQDANEHFLNVQKDSVEAVVQAGRLLGWFPDLE